MKALGIILAGGSSSRMSALSLRRAVAAMPLAGNYRAIDFALSNMSNSSINTVAVVTEYSSHSLNVHLNSPAWWGFGRKQGGLFLLNPTITPENNTWYRGTADALIQNLDFIRSRHEPFVVISSGDCVYKLDLNQVLDFHMQKEADITLVCRKLEKRDEAGRFGVLQLDDEGRVTEWAEKTGKGSGHFVNGGIYVMRRRYLIRLLEECRQLERYNLVQDVLQSSIGERRIMAFVHEGYWNNIASVPSYFACNMDFLKPELRKEFFLDYPVIHTRVGDDPPAKFNEMAACRNSLVGGGCIVNGEVENSVIFRKVYIGNRSRVKNCVILDDCYIGDDVVLENCILEKRVKLEDGTALKGRPSDIRVVSGR